MSDLAIFTYTDRQVRTVLIDDEPWFVAADVAAILGYSATAAMTRRLDEDDKGVQILHTPGGPQEMTIVSESGVYAAVFSSQVAGAKAFKRWVTREVLPEIRRTGAYGGRVPQTLPEALRAAADAMERNAELERLRAIEAPKVEAFDDLMDAEGSYSFEAAAKSLYDVTGGLGRNNLMKELRERGVLMRTNTPYQQYAHWFEVRVRTYEHGGVPHATKTTFVRPEGLDGIRRMFRRSQ